MQKTEIQFEFKKYAWIILLPIFFIMAEWVSVFLHEYAHSFAAWMLGFKADPWKIAYGSLNWENLFFVIGIDEHVNYYLMYLFGDKNAIGLSAFSGPGIATLGLYLLSLLLLQWEKIKSYPYLFYFLFWVNVLNLSELGSYVFLRSFSAHGDIAHVVFGWSISAWWVFILGGVGLSVAYWNFFNKTLMDLCSCLNLRNGGKLFILSLTAFLLFGYPGIRVLLQSYGVVATYMGVIFCVLTPLVVALKWFSASRNKLSAG